MTLKEFFLGNKLTMNKYERCPFLAWLTIIFFMLYGTLVVTIIF